MKVWRLSNERVRHEKLCLRHSQYVDSCGILLSALSRPDVKNVRAPVREQMEIAATARKHRNHLFEAVSFSMSWFLVSHAYLRNLWLDPHSLKMATIQASIVIEGKSKPHMRITIVERNLEHNFAVFCCLHLHATQQRDKTDLCLYFHATWCIHGLCICMKTAQFFPLKYRKQERENETFFYCNKK